MSQEAEQRSLAETTATSPPSPASTSRGRPSGEDLYDYRQCTIYAVIQLRPQGEESHPREVVLSVQNGVGNTEDTPLFRLLTEAELGGPFPPALEALLAELQRQLPERKQRHDARLEEQRRQEGARVAKGQTNKAVQTTATSITVTKAASTPPMSSPIPKQELIQGGLFDESSYSPSISSSSKRTQ
jgi:hypothetical protein